MSRALALVLVGCAPRGPEVVAVAVRCVDPTGGVTESLALDAEAARGMAPPGAVCAYTRVRADGSTAPIE